MFVHGGYLSLSSVTPIDGNKEALKNAFINWKSKSEETKKSMESWRCGVVVITIPELHSTNPELRFCAGSNPARSVLELCDGDMPQKMKFLIKDFFNKCDQIRSFLRIWSHLLKKSLMENFIFCPV